MILIPMILIYTTPAVSITLKTLLLPLMPKVPQQFPLYYTELEVSPSLITFSLSQSHL
jgi:hypothetical protein